MQLFDDLEDFGAFDEAVAGNVRDPYTELARMRREQPVQRLDMSVEDTRNRVRRLKAMAVAGATLQYGRHDAVSHVFPLRVFVSPARVRRSGSKYPPRAGRSH